MIPPVFPNTSRVRHFLALAGKQIAAALLLCLGLTISSAAQSGPICGFGLAPSNGTAPQLVTATGGCSDATGTITSETLDWGDGTQTPISPGSFAAFSIAHTYTAAGTFTVTLTAMDSNGVSGSSAQQETIAAPVNQPPSCTLAVNPQSGNAPLTVNASGNCTDPENDITSTTIDWGDGTNTSGTSGSHTYNNAGNFTVTLTAIDSAGNHGSATQSVSVQVANQPPTCTLQVNPTSGNVPLAVTATGNCTDPNNNISSTTLNWGDGTTTNGASGTHTYTVSGHYNVTLTATDSGGLTGSASQKVNVNKQNQPPTCALSVAPSSGSAPLTVSANGNCSDPENNIVTTVLDWGDGSQTNAASGTHTYKVVATYQVRLTATDSAGNVGTATQTVVVGSGHNAPPQCAMSITPSGGQVPFSATITPNCTDPENDIISITVDFGDGFYTSIAPNTTTNHTYARSGSFTATVTAIDVAGNDSAPSSKSVTASDNPTMFVGVANGQLKQFDESGKALRTLSSNQSGSITGMAFDWLDSLYVTNFNANTVSRFNGNGNLAGGFGSGYNCKPESIVFDNAGNAYVGETGCSHALLKFDAYGNLAAAFDVATEVEGSDWIDLASDQCTIYYTSQGKTVFRFNVCSGQQQAPFATGLSTGLALKILPDNSVLVADKADIVHFDSGGRVIQKYTASGESCWVSLTLDPDGKSFWALDYCSSDVIHFDIASGDQLSKFSSGAPANTSYGIGMRGPAPHIQAAGPLLATPQTANVTAGQSTNLDLAFVPIGATVNQTFTFSCANLPVGAACNFSPQSSTVTSAGVTVRLTITTTAGSAARNWNLWSPQFLAWWTLFGGVLFVGNRRIAQGRIDIRKWSAVFLLATLLVFLIACSASSRSTSGSTPSGNNPPTASSTTPASNYTVVVRATSATAGYQSSTAVSLTVQ